MATTPNLLKVCIALYVIELEAQRFARLLHASAGDVDQAQRVYDVVTAVKYASAA